MHTKIAILLLAAACFNCAFAQEYESIACGTTNITCVCGIGDTKRYIPLELKMYNFDDPATGKSKCVATQDPYQACANVSHALSSNKSDSTDLISYFYPYEFTIPPNGDKTVFGTPHRFKRQSDSCDRHGLENAFVKCWEWPKWVNCDINCIYGHVLRVGEESLSSTNVNCRKSEGIWKPHGFKDCEPLLNCRTKQIKLVKPGTTNCYQPLDAPEYCNISCLDYEEYEATGNEKYEATRKYECVDDSFGQNLPHCAVLDE